jgi:hypothetical protein
MNSLVISTLGLALFATVLALAREMRLRRLLTKLLQIVLSRWRNRVAKNQREDLGSVDHVNRPGDRLR